MPIVFEQPGAYAPGIWAGYGALQQEQADREYALKAQALMQQQNYGGGGGGSSRGGGGGGHAPQSSGWGVGGVGGDRGGGGSGGGGSSGPSLSDQFAYHADLQRTQLSQAEEQRYQNMQRSLAAIEDDDNINPQDKANMKTFVQTGVNPLEMQRQQAQLRALDVAEQTHMREEMTRAKVAKMTIPERTSEVFDPLIQQEVMDELSGQFSDQAQNPVEFNQMIESEIRRRPGGSQKWFMRSDGELIPLAATGADSGGQGRQQEAIRQHDDAADKTWQTQLERVRDRVYGKGTTAPMALQERTFPDPAQPGKTVTRVETPAEAVSRLMEADTGFPNIQSLQTERAQLRLKPFDDRTPRTRLDGHQLDTMSELTQAMTEARRLVPDHTLATFQQKLATAKEIFQKHGSLALIKRNPADLRRYTEAREWITKNLDLFKAEASPPQQAPASRGSGNSLANWAAGLGRRAGAAGPGAGFPFDHGPPTR